MTLVVAIPTPGGPVLIGDVLISAPAASDGRSVRVPTVGEVGQFVVDRPGWAIHGLAQKIIVIDEKCAVAWCGDMETAGAGIAILRQARHPLTAEYIMAAWEQHNHGRPPEQRAGLVGAVVVTNGMELFRTAGPPYEGKNLGALYADGSGVEALDELDWLLGDLEMRSGGVVDPAREALARTLALAGLLITNEIQGDQVAGTLRTLFGGGYELCYYAGNRFQKLDDFAYVVWTAGIVDGKVHSLGPKLIMKQKYFGDWLLLQSVRLEVASNGNGQGSLKALQRFSVPPMYPSGPEPTQAVSFESHCTCHAFEVHEGERVLGWVSRIEVENTDSPPAFTQQIHGDRISLHPRPELLGQAKEWLEMHGWSRP